ncbi:uroporphyrinogen-III synthase [Pseudomonas profundi]|uniref:uroporphyrinogen-III synthase n=1 Tax=Pseudomonas profundi TaxID=1981513 RepID=UPI00123C58FE|nr:uroporphyrinogen-III synthase [Pseudomonas profundi]
MSTAVLLTRSDADNQRLANKLARLGISALSVPLLRIDELDETPEQQRLILDIDRYHAVMVVSPVAARLGLERLDAAWPQPPVGIDWFAVGETTASVLRAYGLPVHTPDSGQDSEALLRLPVWSELLARPDLKILVWRGVGGREHLANHVRAVGGQVDYLELYRREPPQGLATALESASQADVRGIVLASGQGLEHWHAAAGRHWPEQRTWRCWVPSQRVAERAKALGCNDIIVCEGADDSAVLTAIAAHPLTR